MPKLPKFCPDCGAAIPAPKPGKKPRTQCRECGFDLTESGQRKPARSAKPQHSKLPLIAVAFIGGLLLFGGAVTAAAVYFTRKDDTPPVAERPPEKAAPVQPAPIAKQPGSAAPDHLTPEAEQSVRKATVYINVTRPDASTASGSGFFELRSKLVVTNAHVVGMLEPDAAPPSKIEIVLNSGEGAAEKKVSARVTAVDRVADLAVLAPHEIELPMADRPAGLSIVGSNTLRLTQKLYAFGFPFGEGLGKEITATETTVSSLRNGDDGKLQSIQVAGGINPGNSGGPVVDVRGRVAGIAVSGIRGAQIQFAIPSEKLQAMMNGSIGPIVFGPVTGTGADRKIAAKFTVMDPTEKVTNRGVYWWHAKPGPPLAPASGEHQIPGAFQIATMDYDPATGIAIGEVPIGESPPDTVLWALPGTSTRDQKHNFGGSVTLDLRPKSKAVPSKMLFSPTTPPAGMNLVVRTDLRLTADGQEGRRLRTVMQTDLREAFGKAVDERIPVEWQIGYAAMESALDEAPYAPGPRLQKALSTARSSFLKTTFSRRGEPGPIVFQAFQNPNADLTDYSNRLANSIVALSVPLPDGDVQPGDTWKATRTLPIELPGDAQEGTLELTYRYEGMRVFGSHRCANIIVSGELRGIRNRSVELKGKANGYAIVSLQSGRVLRSRLTCDVALQVQIAQGRFLAKGTTEASLARTNDLGAQTGPPPEEFERNPLLGKWKPILTFGAGKEKPKSADPSYLIIEDGRYYHVSRTQSTGPIHYRLRADGKSGLLDAITFPPDGSQGSLPGIYKFDGDTLLLCQNHKNDARPTGYEPTAGSGLVCYHLKRAAADERVVVVAKPIEQPKPKEDVIEDGAGTVPLDPPPAALAKPAEGAEVGAANFPKTRLRSLNFRVTRDGKRLIYTLDKQLIVADFNGRRIFELQEGDNGGLKDISINADGTRCATIRMDETACVWDLEKGKQISKWTVPANARSIAITPGGKQVAIGCEDQSIRFYHADTGKPFRRLDKLGHAITALQYSPDGKLLGVAASGEVQLFHADTGKPASDRKFPVFVDPYFSFTPDGEALWLNGGGTQMVRIRDGSVIKELAIEAHAATMSADGSLVASCQRTSKSFVIVVWSTKTWGEAFRLELVQPTMGFAFALSPCGKWLFYDTADQQIQRVAIPENAREAKPVEPPKPTAARILRTFEAPPAHPILVRYSPDGAKLILNRDRDLSLWDVSTGKRLHRFQWENMAVSQAAFSKDGDIIYAAGGDYREGTDEQIDFRVHVLDAKSGKILRHVDGLRAPAQGIDVSPDGKRLALGLIGSRFELWDLDKLKAEHSIRTQQIPRSISFSPDGKTALAVLAGRIVLFDAEGGREAKSLDKNHLQEAVFLPDGKKILSVGSDGMMRLWDADRGNEIKKWGGEGIAVDGLTISADGKYALARGDKNMLRLWDIESAKEIASWSDPEGWGLVALAPDGKAFVTSVPKGVRLIATGK